MKVIQAEVKFGAGREFDGKYGKRQNIKLIRNDNGEEIDIWFNAGDARYTKWDRGSSVQVIQQGEKFTLVLDDEAPTTPQATPAALSNSGETPTTVKKIKGLNNMDKDTKIQVFQEMCKRSQFLKSCHVQMVSAFTHQETGECIVSEETIQKYTMTLYIDMKDIW
jgi:hypothetical protein